MTETLFEIGRVALKEAGRMWWFTLLGVVLAALIKTYQLDRKMRGYVGKWGAWAVPAATGIGLVSPLCSCGILPVIIPMALAGVPLAPLMALLIVSPVMDPASFWLTWGGVGKDLALWKLGGAVWFGLSAGYLTMALERTGYFSGNLVRLRPVLTPEGTLASAKEIGCANGIFLKSMVVVPRESKFRFFLDRFRDVGVFVGFWVGVAILLDAVIQVLVPMTWVGWLVGGKGPWAVVTAALIGLPLPLSQVPMVPVLAGLQQKGIAVGADLAFMLAGPVTSIPAIVALSAIFSTRVVVVFILTGLGGSILLGLARMALG